MLDAFGLSGKIDLIKEWYDGYIFGNTEVFCPWDVVSYLSTVLYDEEEEPQNCLDADSDDAIVHIIKNGYEKTMPEGYVQQLVYGIAFFGKTAKVKLMRVVPSARRTDKA